MCWAYLSERTAREVLGDEPARTLLFPAVGPRGEAMVYDFRKALDAVAIRAGFSESVIGGGEVVKDKRGQTVLRSTIKIHMLRHTYTAARLQTLDHGAPISPYTVKRELGHGDLRLVEEVYGHLGEIRHRSDAVEYRVEQHEERLRERLAGLAAVPLG